MEELFPAKFLDAVPGFPGIDSHSFFDAHQQNAPVSVRLNPFKPNQQFTSLPAIPWCDEGRYLPERPSFIFDPLFHAGTYYVQEASSMFLDYALKKFLDPKEPVRVLDLCAAPGGKSTLIASRISRKSLLVANEVIAPRASVLAANLIKWGNANVVVTQNDPKDFARLEGYFDIIVADAPCSGSGLFRKDPEARNEWSEKNVSLCSERQQRILADAWPSLKGGGLLLYSTCSYSPQENEEIADWLIETFAAESLPVGTPDDSGIIETQSPKHQAAGYRFYPGKVKGEGFYFAAFRKLEETFSGVSRVALPKLLSRQELPQMENWVYDAAKFAFVKDFDHVRAFFPDHIRDIALLREKLRIRRAGTSIGRWLPAQDIIPDHELALGLVLGNQVQSVDLDRETALRYLRRETISVPGLQKGWTLARYENHPLGWMKVLPNRINNYYPQEWRILKELRDN